MAIDEVDAVCCAPHPATPEAEAAAATRAASLLARLRPSGSAPPRFLLSTAHLSEPHELALAALFPGLRSVRHTGVLVPTLRQVFHYFRGNKDEKLLAVLDGEGAVGSATMVFCASRDNAERVHAVLAAERPELRSTMLHDETPTHERAASMGAFRAGESSLLVATMVAARKSTR